MYSQSILKITAGMIILLTLTLFGSLMITLIASVFISHSAFAQKK